MVRAILALALALVGSAAAFTTSTNRLVTAPARVSSSALSMKLYDWKRREANEDYSADAMPFYMDNIKPAPGSHKKKTRKGRGIAAGQGATCGFGMRGQSSRSGRPERPGFEGNQTPLYRRLPKMVGRPMGPGHTREVFNLVNLEQLNKCVEGATVSLTSLQEAKIATKTNKKVTKVVGGGDLTVNGLTVNAHAFTASAKAAIEGAGGKCVTLSKTTGLPLVAA